MFHRVYASLKTRDFPAELTTASKLQQSYLDEHKNAKNPVEIIEGFGGVFDETYARFAMQYSFKTEEDGKDMNALKKNKNALRAKNAEIKNDKINKMADFEAQKRALQNANLQMDKEKLSDNNPELKKAIEQQQAENRIKMQEIDDQAKAYSMSADNAISANEQQIQDIDSELTEKGIYSCPKFQ